MNYIVLDLEWNQATEEQKKKEIPFEIIEIGAIKMDESFNVIGEFSQLIRPKIYHDMHKITESLIHIQMEDLERGNPFPHVMEEFLKWCGEEYIFCTWGPSDLTELQRNMRYYEMTPLSDRPIKFYDLQKIFGISFEDKTVRKSLEYAVDFLEIPKDIPFHRAFSDAYYAAKVFSTCSESSLKYVSFDTFVIPQNKQKEVKIIFPDYIKYISRSFKSKQSITADKDIMSMKCYLCKKPVRKKVKWFTPNGKHYYSVSHCEEHGFIKGKIRVRKTEDGRSYAVKTMKLISREQMQEIIDRKEKAKLQRKLKKEQEQQKRILKKQQKKV